MHLGVKCIGENETLATAAKMMREMHVGSLPICGKDDRLQGIITDRDIVVRCVADGCDPQVTTARELAQGTPIWVNADADAKEVLQLMESNKIRRLPVVEGHRLVGMISEADLATHLDEKQLSKFVETVYSAPPNS
jgi:CBS domain-containing protein